jgi:hypothetical protein
LNVFGVPLLLKQHSNIQQVEGHLSIHGHAVT